MVSASLEQIYAWTGVRVDCFVNILRPESALMSNDENIEDREEWKPVQDLGTRAEVVESELNEAMVKKDVGDGAYLVSFCARIGLFADGRLIFLQPSVDIELRYYGEEIDMGVFAPEEMLSIVGAEQLIEDFVAFWK